MARKSHQALRLEQQTIIEFKRPRIQPPQDMPTAQRAVWSQTVDNLPHDWFAAEQSPVLIDYCNLVVRAAQIEAALAGVDPVDDIATFDKLVKLAGLVSAKIGMHARAMRLTQQSRLRAETASNRGAAAAAVMPKPWLVGEGQELLAS